MLRVVTASHKKLVRGAHTEKSSAAALYHLTDHQTALWSKSSIAPLTHLHSLNQRQHKAAKLLERHDGLRITA